MVLHSSGTSIKFTDIEDEFGVINGTNTRKLGSYRVSETYGSLTAPLDDGIPQSGPIKFSDFYSKRLNMVVNYYDGAHETRKHGKTTYDNNAPGDVSVVGPGDKSRPSATGSSSASGGSKVIIHVNKAIGSVVDNNLQYCALRTGGWDTGTVLEVNVGSQGKIIGAGGNGGAGGSGRSGGPWSGSNGTSGTSGLGIEYNGTIVKVESAGVIQTGYGGGGGGAGSKRQNRRADGHAAGGGGGGGAGYPAGAGGTADAADGGNAGNPGHTATDTNGSLEIAIGGLGGNAVDRRGARSGKGGGGAIVKHTETTTAQGGQSSRGSQTGSGGSAGSAGSAIRKSTNGTGFTLTIAGTGAVTGEKANEAAGSGGSALGVL